MFLQAVSHEAVYWNSNKLRGAAVSVSLSSFASISIRHSVGVVGSAIASLGICLAVVPPKARSSAWLERTPDKRKVGSSSLPGPTSLAGPATTIVDSSPVFDPASVFRGMGP